MISETLQFSDEEWLMEMAAEGDIISLKLTKTDH